MTTGPDIEYGEAFLEGARAERHRRYAKLFSKAMTTTDAIEQARLIAEIRRMVRTPDHRGQDA